jgi:hypothetical protein
LAKRFVWAKQKGTVPATKQWWYDEKGVHNGTEVHELWCW